MQIDNVKEKRFRNSFHCFSNIVRHHGVSTLFRGWNITVMRDCTYLSTYFFIYEGAKQSLLQQNGHLQAGSWAAVPLAGGAAGTTAWLLAYPLDCIRASLQGQCLLQGPNHNSRQVLEQLLSRRGVQGLFQGIVPTLFRAPFVHSMRFSAYECFLILFRTLRKEDHWHGAPAPFFKTR